MIVERYGLFDLYTKNDEPFRYIRRHGGEAFYRIPINYEIEPFTRKGRREMIDRIFDGTFDVVIINPSAIIDFGSFLKTKGFECRTFNANAF